MPKGKAKKTTEKVAFKIEKGIPLPPKLTDSKYPIKDLKVGDSFLVPGRATKQFTGMYTGAKKLGMKVALRGQGDGVRVWRVK